MKKSQQSKIKMIKPEDISALKFIGNSNILGCHIKTLEERLFQKINATPPSKLSLENDADYYLWLLTIGVHVEMMVEHIYARNHPNLDPAKEKIRVYDMIEFIRKKEEFDNDKSNYIHDLIALRNALVHWGLPNEIKKFKNKAFLKLIEDGEFGKLKKHYENARKMLHKINNPIIKNEFFRIGNEPAI